MTKISKLFILFAPAIFTACSGGGNRSTRYDGDTLYLKYATNLTVVRYDDYTTVELADPWNSGKTLHTYILVPTDKPKPHDLPEGTVVGIPLRKAVIATSVHCGLVESLGRKTCIAGVCDLQYINLPWVVEQCKQGSIADCGSGLAPTIETIIDLSPDAIFLSPFQNNGGYGKLEDINVPIIETADYMETSALGRAEWMKYYGMLFGAEKEAEEMFAQIEADYLHLKQLAKTSNVRPSMVMDKQTGSVWYVPGGCSTVGRLIADANIEYPYADDDHSGSVPLPFESVLEKAGNCDIWAFRYNSATPATFASILSEHHGYSQLKAFQNHEMYGCNTATSTFYEDTPFHPNLLLRDFIIMAHPDLDSLGTTQYFIKIDH